MLRQPLLCICFRLICFLGFLIVAVGRSPIVALGIVLETVTGTSLADVRAELGEPSSLVVFWLHLIRLSGWLFLPVLLGYFMVSLDQQASELRKEEAAKAQAVDEAVRRILEDLGQSQLDSVQKGILAGCGRMGC